MREPESQSDLPATAETIKSEHNGSDNSLVTMDSTKVEDDDVNSNSTSFMDADADADVDVDEDSKPAAAVGQTSATDAASSESDAKPAALAMETTDEDSKPAATSAKQLPNTAYSVDGEFALSLLTSTPSAPSEFRRWSQYSESSQDSSSCTAAAAARRVGAFSTNLDPDEFEKSKMQSAKRDSMGSIPGNESGGGGIGNSYGSNFEGRLMKKLASSRQAGSQNRRHSTQSADDILKSRNPMMAPQSRRCVSQDMSITDLKLPPPAIMQRAISDQTGIDASKLKFETTSSQLDRKSNIIEEEATPRIQLIDDQVADMKHPIKERGEIIQQQQPVLELSLPTYVLGHIASFITIQDIQLMSKSLIKQKESSQQHQHHNYHQVVIPSGRKSESSLDDDKKESPLKEAENCTASNVPTSMAISAELEEIDDSEVQVSQEVVVPDVDHVVKEFCHLLIAISAATAGSPSPSNSHIGLPSREGDFCQLTITPPSSPGISGLNAASEASEEVTKTNSEAVTTISKEESANSPGKSNENIQPCNPSNCRPETSKRRFTDSPAIDDEEEEKIELSPEEEELLAAAKEGRQIHQHSFDEAHPDSNLEVTVQCDSVDQPDQADQADVNNSAEAQDNEITIPPVIAESIPLREKVEDLFEASVTLYDPNHIGGRSNSLYQLEADDSLTPAQRRATYAFETNGSFVMRELAGLDMVDATDCITATLVDDEPIQTVEAVVVPLNDDNTDGRRWKRQIAFIWAPILLVCGMLALIVAVILATKNKNPTDSSDGSIVTSTQEKKYDPTLIQVRKEGVLRCGVPEKYGFCSFNEDTGVKEGSSVDFCKAVAAAVLGPDYKVDLVDVTSLTRFTALADHEIDLLLYGDTHTMQRDFYEVGAKVGFQFTDPYFYDGLGFGGKISSVECADNINWLGDCRSLKICVHGGTTHVDILGKLFPQQNIVPKYSVDSFLQALIDGECNVIAGELNVIAEISVRNAGYTEDYVMGSKVLSKEPLAMVSRKDDQTWSDVLNWVLRILIHAETINITQADHIAYSIESPPLYGLDFSSALAAVGNYGEIYSRHLQVVAPRKGLNLIYTDNEGYQSGLHYSHPFGVLDTFHYEFSQSGKIFEILNRGKLICGVLGSDEDQVTELGDEINGSLDHDYCRALSASLFTSDPSLVEFVQLTKEDNWLEKLDSGEIDVIAGVTLDFHNDLTSSNTTTTGLSGFSFSMPYFYGKERQNLFSNRFSPRALATSQIDPDWSHLVYWIVSATFWAEENGITHDLFMEVPEIKLFGLKFEWLFRGSIFGVGNYQEMYYKNNFTLPPRGNANLLNDGSSPQIFTYGDQNFV